MVDSIEQAIRKSHCSNAGKEHVCIGTCRITPTGVELDCQKCGKDANPIYTANAWLEGRAADILHAAGMSFARLNEETKLAVLRQIAKDFCPNCKQIHIHDQRYPSYLRCQCGWIWYVHSGWKPETRQTPALSL